jgi:hypothetical protein
MQILVITPLLAFLAFGTGGQTSTHSIRPDDARICNQREAIETYSRDLDSRLKTLPKRTFVSEFSEQPTWAEGGTDREGNVANLFLKDGKPIVAAFTLSSESGDWTLFATYYFRRDGTLAKMHELLNTFYGNASVIRETFLTCSGSVVAQSVEHLDLKTKKKKRPDPDFINETSPLFKRIESLPFFDLLARPER